MQTMFLYTDFNEIWCTSSTTYLRKPCISTKFGTICSKIEENMSDINSQ